ncbi:MAG TPA: ATP-binding cassette domain-containing protein, partial [Reyranella sp.]|nr:ATP-binding cassette domain-containing protein [Reyranella sp.]
YESFLYLVCHWTILAVSWNILSGYSGYFSFGHGAFFGVGMYTSAYLAANLAWPFLATLPAAAALAALLGIGLGAVVFRVKAVRGELFALLTLAVTFVVATIVLNTPVDGGPGVYLHSVAVPALGPTPSSSFYLMALAGAAATLAIAWWIFVSRLGIGLFAIHDDEDVAEVMGVPTFRYKLLAFGISCAFAGLAGGIHALFVTYVTVAETFNITVPLTVVLMSVLGGIRHWAGPAVGALAITCLLYFFTAGIDPLVGRAAVGIILVVVILFMPQGILGFLLKRGGPRARAQASASRQPTAVDVRGAAGTAPAPSAGRASGAAPATGPGSASGPAFAIRAVPATGAAPLLEVREISKSFKGVRALDSVSLDVRQGEILGLLGPNGSGKSTFINVVSGHFPASGGEIRFRGMDLAGLDAHRIARAGIARTYQIPRPFAHMSVLQNVSLVAMFGGAALDQRHAVAEAWQWLEFTGLQDKAAALPDELNLHQRKFLELARALASRPKLVLLDEVLSGLTPAEINDAIDLIRRIRDRGATIVFVEHVMRAVVALADRVVVLNHGRLIAEGPCDAVMNDSEVVRAYLGTAHA